MAKQRIKSRPGLFGTIYYYDENGNPIGQSRPGLLEGTRVYTDQNGRYVGKSRPGYLAKEVFTDAKHNYITSYEGLFGDVHFKNGVPVGHTKPGLFDSAYTTLEAGDDASDEEYCEDGFEEEWLEDEECFDDAAYEAGKNERKNYSPKVSQFTLVKSLQQIFLFLVICMITACIYAII
jgi:hypothetical protein